ncbi:MAG: hypothetical protein FJ315_07335 [SAR202 cluster bacterium]|nr:hypothetical protein [SAR202 cluster bacterium]
MDNAAVRLDERNEPQPDLLLMIGPERGGRVRLSSEDYTEDPDIEQEGSGKATAPLRFRLCESYRASETPPLG